MKTTLADYLRGKYKSLQEQISQHERRLAQDVLNKTALEMIAAKYWIDAQTNLLRRLREDIGKHLDTDEFYAFVIDNLEPLKREYYWVKDVVVKHHISRMSDFKALHWNFVP